MMMNSAPKNRADDDMAEKIDQGIMSATNNYTPTSLGQVSTAKPPSDPSSGTAKGAAAAAEGKSGSDSDEFEIPQRYTKNGRKRAVSFPLKLMKALSCKEHSDIIAWLPCGKKFKIIRPRAFKQEVLPRYFKEAKYSSFKRKLHRWGFERDGTLEQQQYSDDWFGSEVFSNPNFQKNNVELLEKMSCKKDVPAPPASASILSHLSQMQSKPGTAAASGIGYQLHVPAPNIPSAEGYKNVAAASAAAHAQLMANPTFQANQHQHQRFSPASSALRQTEATMESRVQEELIRRRVQGQLPQLAATMQLRPDETAETVQSRVAMSVEAEIERRTKERLESLSKSLGAPAPASALNEMQSAALSRQQQLSHQGGMNYPTQSQFDSLVAAQSFQSSSLSGSTPASNLDTLSQQRRVGNTSMLPAEAATLETRQRILALEKKISELQQLQRSTIEGSQTRGQQVSTTRPQVNTAGFIPQSLQQGFRGQQPQQQQQQQQQQPTPVFAQQEETAMGGLHSSMQSRMAMNVEAEVNRRLQERIEALERARGQKLERLPPIQSMDASNAKIEEEVTRRLQDRVMAASMARRQQLHSMLQSTSMAAELQHQQQQHQQQQHSSLANMASSSSTAGGRQQQQQQQATMQPNPNLEGIPFNTAESLLKQQYERLGIPAQQETRPLQSLPRPNRDHARTA